MAQSYHYARETLGKAVERQRQNYDARAEAAGLEVGATELVDGPLGGDGKDRGCSL